MRFEDFSEIDFMFGLLMFFHAGGGVPDYLIWKILVHDVEAGVATHTHPIVIIKISNWSYRDGQIM